tara:strand:+ start:212 stop:499 length:288 start_codon:yes stop_codon:yes gene_type:complete
MSPNFPSILFSFGEDDKDDMFIALDDIFSRNCANVGRDIAALAVGLVSPGGAFRWLLVVDVIPLSREAIVPAVLLLLFALLSPPSFPFHVADAPS